METDFLPLECELCLMTHFKLTENWESVGVNPWRLGHKRFCGFCFALLWITVSGGSQLPLSWGHWILWRGSHGKETEASCQQPWGSHPGNTSSSPSQAFRWAQPQLESWMETQEILNQNNSAKLLLNSWPTETEIIYIYCFRPQNFGVTFYVATNDPYSCAPNFQVIFGAVVVMY